MKNYFYTFFLIPFLTFQTFAQEIKMQGTIIDAATKKSIEFVNMGVVNKNKGTVSNENGAFNLSFPSTFSKDSLTISHVNYISVTLPIENLTNKNIFLLPQKNVLAEVQISKKKKTTRKFGVRTYNPLLWLGALSENNDIIEIAQRINIPKKEVHVKYINIYLRQGFESDSSYIRVNFYKNQDDKPDEKLIFENTVQKKKIAPGWLQIDLTDQNIYINEDFFVGVEFLPNFDKPLDVYIGAILTKGKGYSRSSSQGVWKKLQGASTINVEVEY